MAGSSVAAVRIQVRNSTAKCSRCCIQSRLVHGMEGRGDDAMLRAGLAAAMLVGVITSRRIIGVAVLVAADTNTLVKTLGPEVQRLLGR
jgi:hypothetical protein